jgi:hypothetical protein
MFLNLKRYVLLFNCIHLDAYTCVLIYYLFIIYLLRIGVRVLHKLDRTKLIRVNLPPIDKS